ncbi:hypothetical protein TCON_1906 [Astathelohania contejeani]|uniref:Uncharacterized protein n=1 Tax=Astathelohania contejeani TaxID=164912 RepID=A0ABQ7HXI6_9MICR|nr:hypothetical protein TCON_1906 [Thelohania contejeani]
MIRNIFFFFLFLAAEEIKNGNFVLQIEQHHNVEGTPPIRPAKMLDVEPTDDGYNLIFHIRERFMEILPSTNLLEIKYNKEDKYTRNSGQFRMILGGGEIGNITTDEIETNGIVDTVVGVHLIKH